MKELKYNPEMQLAVDEGRKTQTRRVVETDSEILSFFGKAENKRVQYWKEKHLGKFIFELKDGEYFDFCPYGKIGDINNGCLITDIRVERLQKITKEDAHAEGVSNTLYGWPDAHDIMEFEKLWKSIYPNHPTKAWELNPYVWVITFEKVNE